ncbi:MAG: DUF2188 domain-containing protein [Anaerolineae bacterium]
MAKQTVKKNYVVSPRKNGTWVVKKEGARCATQTLDSRDAAEAAARELAESEGVEVVIEE